MTHEAGLPHDMLNGYHLIFAWIVITCFCGENTIASKGHISQCVKSMTKYNIMINNYDCLHNSFIYELFFYFSQWRKDISIKYVKNITCSSVAQVYFGNEFLRHNVAPPQPTPIEPMRKKKNWKWKREYSIIRTNVVKVGMKYSRDADQRQYSRAQVCQFRKKVDNMRRLIESGKIGDRKTNEKYWNVEINMGNLVKLGTTTNERYIQNADDGGASAISRTQWCTLWLPKRPNAWQTKCKRATHYTRIQHEWHFIFKDR